MNKGINNNGYNYVDLGLPSGTLWATCNVGASKPSDCGLYFQWGDTVGYTYDQIGKDKQFCLTDYKWYLSGFFDDIKFSKYTKEGEALKLEDDAAHYNMGGDWHMPIVSQLIELKDNTITTWTTLDDVNGMLFTSKQDTSKSIFIPTEGGARYGLVDRIGVYGGVWSSMLNTYGAYSSHYLYIGHRGAYLSSYHRYHGLSVRGVIDNNNNLKKK